jgi:hypothetical protein
MKNYKKYLALFLLTISLVSCSNDDASTNNQTVDVYIAGTVLNENHAEAAYWKNGELNQLTNGENYVSADDISVKDNDIYVVGTEHLPGYKTVAKLWKNGVPTNLSNPMDIVGSYAKCLAINGNDVYVGGFTLVTNHSIAKYWKNGEQEVILSDVVDRDAYVYDIAVSGNDIYAVGTEENQEGIGVAVFWKNGVKVALSSSGRTSSATGVYINGNDVYIAGFDTNAQNNSVATYWKNAVPFALSDGSFSERASNIFVKGTDVYVCGVQYNPETDGNSMRYWKNGEPVILSQGINTSVSTGISVVGNDVHVTGHEKNTAGVYIAKHWVNDVKTDLSTTSSEANGLFIKEN